MLNLIEKENKTFTLKSDILKFKLSKEHNHFVSLISMGLKDIVNIQRLMSNACVLKFSYNKQITIGSYVCKLLCSFRAVHSMDKLTAQQDILISIFVDNYRSGKLQSLSQKSPVQLIETGAKEAWDKIKYTINSN